VGAWLFMIDLLTGGWSGFAEKVGQSAGGMVGIISGAWTVIQSVVLGVIAKVKDAVADLLSKVPDGIKSAFGIEGPENAGDGKAFDKVRRDARDQLNSDARTAREFAKNVTESLNPKGQVVTRSSAQFIPADVSVNVTVPPGTPAQQARAVASAAKTGTTPALASAPNRSVGKAFPRGK
jgi:hypothetical protein